MDLSAMIITIVLAGLFFGFVLWMAFHSRRNTAKETDSNTSQINLKGK